NVGVMFPRFFEGTEKFKEIETSHEFQELTEYNKAGTALRKGIYLTNVVENADTGDVMFNLLRCSSNFNGPTDNFASVDREILEKANEIAQFFFENPAEMNHVLAQIYFNHRDPATSREKKASIQKHADKTKDFSPNALIAFTTFYDFENV